MDAFRIQDALTNDIISFDPVTGDAAIEKRAAAPQNGPVESVFFPGCSFLNYAMPLVSATYDLLLKHGVVQGISVLCCGKILSYEPDGQKLRDAFEAQLRDHMADSGIAQLVCACPNCVKALREAFANDPRTSGIRIVALPQVLADLGYELDASACTRLVKGEAADDVLFCVHDSCPDRATGEFAQGLRALIPEGLWVDPEHAYKRSICCGSLPRAAGKFEQADKCALTNAEEACAVEADAIITACMSCTFQLNMAQPLIQCVHYLEMLFSWRIDWSRVGAYMKLRFLFDETLGCTEGASEGRAFAGLSSAEPTVADAKAESEQEAHALTEQDAESARDVPLSNKNTRVIGE